MNLGTKQQDVSSTKSEELLSDQKLVRITSKQVKDFVEDELTDLVFYHLCDTDDMWSEDPTGTTGDLYHKISLFLEKFITKHLDLVDEELENENICYVDRTGGIK